MRVIKILFCVSVVFFVIASYRQIFLNTFLHYDEVGNYLPAWNYVHHKQYAFTVQNPDMFYKTSPFITIGAYVGYSLTLFVSWIDTQWHEARIWIFLHGICLLVLLYVFVKKYFDKPTALIACTILMLNSGFIVYSTRIMGEIPALTNCFLGLYAYSQGKEKKNIVWYGLAILAFEISVFSKEYFAVLIGLTLFFIWLFIEKCRLTPTFVIGIILPSGVLAGYFLHFKEWQTIQLYLTERQIYNVEFFAFKFNALQFVILKPLIWIGYILHTVKCYVQKRTIDIFLWLFQTLYILFFIVSIGFERFGIGLYLISAIYVAEFLHGIHYIPALTQVQKIGIYLLLIIALIQKSPYLLWKKAEKIPTMNINVDTTYIIHTPELSLVPLMTKYKYQLPLYPPAKFKTEKIDAQSIKIVQNQCFNADVLILGEYAFTEYSKVYDKNKIAMYFEKIQTIKGYEIWAKNKKSERKTL